MEDIVAVAVDLDTGARRFFLTWGRIHEKVDPLPLEQLLLKLSTRFDLGGTPIRAHVCGSLQAAVHEPYFHECFFLMCQIKIPFGPKYHKWQQKMNKKMNRGKELYYLGRGDSLTPSDDVGRS